MPLAEILAATLTFAFDGLLMFQGGAQGKQNVVVVNALNHDHGAPHICVRRNDPPIEVGRIDLRPGDVVNLGVPPGRVLSSDLYRQHVPELKRFVRRGKIITDPSSSESIITSIPLPQGTLVPWRAFSEKVGLIQINNELAKFCLPRFVVLQTTVLTQPPEEVNLSVTHHSGGVTDTESVELLDGDVIFISNVSQEPDRLHFPAYARLLSAGGRLGGIDVLDHDYCDTELNVGTFSELIENTLLSHTPTPNGDCGQVRNQGGG